MRIRTLISIVLTVGWILPAGALACPPHAAEADAHSHAAHNDSHEHAHGASDRGDVAHDHVAAPEPREGEPGAPTDASICCRAGTRVPTVVASMLDAKPRPKSIPLALSNSLLDLPQPAALLSRARLRLHQPAPLPYVRTRRPLLI
jgi:hypothetical protein